MPGYSVPDQSPFTISPDHKMVAFTIRQADPLANSYCQGLYVADLTKPGSARQIDAGGEIIYYTINNLRGLVNPSGTPAIITPAWSPDGRWIAYLKRTNHVSQIWRVRADGSSANAVTTLDVDAEAVAWSSDGSHLIFSIRPALADLRRKIDEEGRGGYRQDKRVIPVAGPKPFPPAPVAFEYRSIDPATGVIREASADERIRLDPMSASGVQKGTQALSIVRGNKVWIVSRFPGLYQSPNVLLFQKRNDRAPVRCPSAQCRDHLEGAWLSPDGREVRYLRREGWANSQLALYRWIPGKAPTIALRTDAVLSNCQDANGLLVCGRESSREPIRLVAIDPVTGISRTIVDPNPEFATLRLGKVQRLHWKTAYGSESFGDLILPPDHREGERHPLIVTQYTTRGFLRGATGDQYPIFPFAARGFAVLSLDRPARWAEAKARVGDRRTWEQFERENNRDWMDRRNVLSSLITGLQTVEKLGVVDPGRIGITGTSEGAMGIWFALANTEGIFAAASMGSCCMDPKSLMAVGGEAWAKVLQESGYPAYRDRHDNFWEGISLAENVDRITIPLLIQVPDDEYAMALETVATYRELNRPVEFYVFPQEHHAIWQPAHRLAMYRRNLDWFERWLVSGESKRID
jgi:dipeptidyl aminopeptidase/acylaminoacyl peptidase